MKDDVKGPNFRKPFAKTLFGFPKETRNNDPNECTDGVMRFAARIKVHATNHLESNQSGETMDENFIGFQDGIDPEQNKRSNGNQDTVKVGVSLCIRMLVKLAHDTMCHEEDHRAFVEKLAGSAHCHVEENRSHANQA